MTDQTTKQDLTTRAGTALTPEYEAELTAEAEAGFDPRGLVKRPAGRPSLSGTPGRSSRLDVRIDDRTREQLQRIAVAQDRRLSDVVREALAAYVAAR